MKHFRKSVYQTLRGYLGFTKKCIITPHTRQTKLVVVMYSKSINFEGQEQHVVYKYGSIIFFVSSSYAL